MQEAFCTQTRQASPFEPHASTVSPRTHNVGDAQQPEHVAGPHVVGVDASGLMQTWPSPAGPHVCGAVQLQQLKISPSQVSA
jgi:hypothetical protein